ncbi:MAG: CDP-diacylglycerol--serine O-phosphatidyltransferase [Chlamydiae bacterium GWC2_50_10]|nr:MAG: CDP-diacylglycerol--serine O-phosphatidyltransferase [Chlamydiae bacterium GWA2_50_15]OGN54856.1 MAG: CDP-diacylglycerol--serine O-phosphatidyltransferase [Chlamydiae bacterium GWC2_50_10]OGN55590.1 MAG: CDP-diacylglycerol--serine O-phosphatidyltransferase [Chlamydiae bacterium GWF2_49_8]OGN58962.1 MAG: CDP-diacylglycerol--serine O-phosphatidyltransferase [Chlamydiae bacterium RIFCSPHIGHO2_02_FULL_49_29]OGN64465.1 MAG: CDP-diacylglycerol--serine O-phosphatidyltransferase [Chlamydiae bac
MKRIQFFPHVITAFGLSCGLFVIFKVNMIEPGAGTYQVLFVSTLLLLVAGFADLLDGVVARAMHSESSFGLIFDSLADAVSFGVAPSVVTLKSLSLEQGTPLSFFAVFGAMLFSIGGVLRLVRYSVQAKEGGGKQGVLVDQSKHFTGLPIPAAALALISVNLFFASPQGERWISPSLELRAIIFSSLMIILGYFMVSRWKFPSAKALHFRLASTELVLSAVVIAIVILYGSLYFFSLILGSVMWSYIILGWILSIIRLIAGKKSKTLEDFEPDQED